MRLRWTLAPGLSDLRSDILVALTPSNDNTDDGVRPTRDTEHRKVPHMLVLMNCKKEPDVKVRSRSKAHSTRHKKNDKTDRYPMPPRQAARLMNIPLL